MTLDPKPTKDGKGISFDLQPSQLAPSQADLALELCDASGNRWIYLGALPRDSRPLVPVTMLRVFDESGEQIELWIDNPPRDLAPGMKVKVRGSKAILTFRSVDGGRRLRAQLPVGVWTDTESLSLEILGDQGKYMLNVASPLDLSRNSWPILGYTILGSIAALALLQILCFGGALLLQRFDLRSPSGVDTGTRPEPKSTGGPSPLPDTKKPLGSRPADTVIDPRGFAPAPIATRVELDPTPPPQESRPRLPVSSAEANLLRLVNEWWAGDPRRSYTGLLELAKRQGVPNIEFYESTNLEANLSDFTQRRLSFKPSRSKTLEWIFCRNGGELLALPLDERTFEAGQALRLVARLFEGVDPEAKFFRFESAERACRLQEDRGEYRSQEMGRLQVAGSKPAKESPRRLEPVPVPVPSVQVAVVPSPTSDMASFVETIQKIFDRPLADFRASLANLVTSAELDQFLTRIETNIASRLQEMLARIDAISVQRQEPASPASIVPAEATSELWAAEAEKRVMSLGAAGETRPAPVVPAKVIEPELPAEPKAESFKPSGELNNFARKLEDALLPLLPSLLSAGAQPSAADYLNVLGPVNQQLVKVLDGWIVDILHFAIPQVGGRGRIEVHVPRGINDGVVTCTCGQLSQDMLFQLAIGIKKPNAPFYAVLVPSGCRMDRYGAGYRLLLGTMILPDASVNPARTKRCAILQRVDDSNSEVYQVVRPMEVVFE